MANPGYPMQPMGGPPMMGQPPMRPPQQMIRRGTPKAVPVIVSAGLAVGVFCGLLFGLGTGGEEAKADTQKEKKFVGTKIDGTDEASTSTGPVGPTPPKSVTAGEKTTGVMKEPKGSAAGAGSAGSASTAQGSAAGSGGGSATVAVPTIKMAKLMITIKPDTVKDAAITVDGTEVKNGVFDVALGDKDKKEVTVVVKAAGFKDLEQKLEVEGETKVEYQLVKAHSSSGGVNPPKRPPPPGGSGTKKGGTKKGGGGLIDI